jgi:hypothetical protein
MTIDLATADTMIAHGRYCPAWEVQELSINYAIRDRLSAHFQGLPPPVPRVGCEYGVNAITNIVLPDDRDRHPIDLAVLHPIERVSVDSKALGGFAWAPENCAVLGLIEVKKNFLRAKGDASILSEMLSLAPVPHMRPFEWVLLVVFVSGRDRQHVNSVVPVLQPLDLITTCDPHEVEIRAGSENVTDRWFDVVCYGRAINRDKVA